MAASFDWVLLAYRLPREPSTPRISVWRKLKRLGVAQLLDGLIDRYKLYSDPALVRLARIVHAADINADIDTDPAGLGLLLIGIGGLDVESDDYRLLDRGSFVYDALYAWCQRDTR